MNTIDNMGGIISVEYILPEQLDFFIPTTGTVFLSLRSGNWKNIPMSYMGCDTQEEIEITDSGTLVTNDITIQLPYNRISRQEIQDLRDAMLFTGIILRIATAERNYYVIGSPDYPLQGTIKHLIPKNTTEFRGYQINISSKSVVQMLLLLSK